jgi:hypothetical protein
MIVGATILGLSLIIGTVPAAVAREKAPDVTADGLHRVEGSELALVYLKPGASFGGYDKLMILDCFVAFKKHWSAQDPTRGSKVTAKDMENIKEYLAAEFRKTFIQELQTKGGYEVVDAPGEDVLLVRPAIINLDVTAPDTMEAGRSRSFSTSAGQMTLYVELYDSATSDLLARVIDAGSGRSSGPIEWQTKVTNRAQADKILRKWAGVLRERLDEAHDRRTRE